MATSDNYDLQNDQMPVFLINGFLDAGKTDFIKYTLSQPYFQSDGLTLLLLCEEGESEYEEDFLARNNTVSVRIGAVTELNAPHLQELEQKYQPERVLLEWNGLWNQDDLYGGPMSEQVLAAQQGRDVAYIVDMPAHWALYQVITLVDGSTLDLYLNNMNMRSFLGQMLRRSELCIVNRCDGIPEEKLVDFRRKIRAMGQNAAIILEDKNGQIPQETLPEDLPYDLEADRIDVQPEDYGIWFVDCMDHPERYRGKTVSFAAMILKRPSMPKNEFVPGRMAMTCCAQDMSFLGFVCRGNPKDLSAYKTGDWAKLTAEVGIAYRSEYNGEGPLLSLRKIARTSEIAEPVGF